MTYFVILILALLSSAAIATSTSNSVDARNVCISQPPPGFVDAAAKMAETERTSSNSVDLQKPDSSSRAVTPATGLTVRVYMHLVAGSRSRSDGYISDSQIRAQFNVLKNNFAPTNIKLVLAGADRVINAAWTVDTPGTELTMKKRLRKGDYRTLNLYFLKAPQQDSLGYCSFPGIVVPGSESFYLDGCTIRYDTVPGGSATNYNQGKTVTHEVGHWFGLLHTFEGNSCTGTGDLIGDTPAQLTPTDGCPTGKDSCPSQPGLDPVRNYMDYSFDSCYTNFSPLQRDRMFNMYSTYRASLYR